MVLQKPIQGVFFDMGWTVFRPVNADWFINRAVMEHVDINVLMSLPQNAKDAVFSKALKYLDDNHNLSTEDEELEQFGAFYTMIAEGLPELGLTEEAIGDIAYSKVFDTSNYVFYDGVKPVLEELKQNYRLGVISDTWPSIERILRSAGIADLFDVKVYSYQLGVSKPHPQIYKTALQRMGVPAQRTIFIDDWEPNLDAAAEQGMNPVLITTRPNTPNSGKYPTVDHISDIFQLLQ